MTERPLALITGASRGIGAAIATAFADDHDLLLLGRDRVALNGVADGLRSAKPVPVELTDFDAVRAAIAGIDRLDVLVHSAGIAEIAPLVDMPAQSWLRTYEVNVVAVAELTRLLLPALRAAAGHVVLINSGQGRAASAGWGAYAASKFALRAYAAVLRAEELPNGVRVSAIYPGRTATDMQRGVRNAEGGEFEPERYLRPESVAAAVRAAVLASADADLTEIVLRPRA